MSKSLLALTLTACCLAAPALAQNKVRPGLGDDPGAPETAPFQLPSGVELAGPIWGADADGGACPEADAVFGAEDGGVKVCVPLRNSSGGPRRVFLEDGLMIVSESRDGQNGMGVEPVQFDLPPESFGSCKPVDENAPVADRKCEPENGDPDSVFIVQLNLRCVNEGRSPSFSGMRYRIGGVTSDPELLALAKLLATKDLSSTDAQEIATAAVYEITESRGLTPETRRKVEALPARRG